MWSDAWHDPAGLCQGCSVNGGPGSPPRAGAHPKHVAWEGQVCICSMLQGADNARLLMVAEENRNGLCVLESINFAPPQIQPQNKPEAGSSQLLEEQLCVLGCAPLCSSAR